MHDEHKLPDNHGSDFQTEVTEYLLKVGADLDEPGDLHEPAIRSAIKSFDDAGRKIPEWAEQFRETK